MVRRRRASTGIGETAGDPTLRALCTTRLGRVAKQPIQNQHDSIGTGIGIGIGTSNEHRTTAAVQTDTKGQNANQTNLNSFGVPGLPGADLAVGGLLRGALGVPDLRVREAITQNPAVRQKKKHKANSPCNWFRTACCGFSLSCARKFEVPRMRTLVDTTPAARWNASSSPQKQPPANVAVLRTESAFAASSTFTSITCAGFGRGGGDVVIRLAIGLILDGRP